MYVEMNEIRYRSHEIQIPKVVIVVTTRELLGISLIS